MRKLRPTIVFLIISHKIYIPFIQLVCMFLFCNDNLDSIECIRSRSTSPTCNIGLQTTRYKNKRGKASEDDNLLSKRCINHITCLRLFCLSMCPLVSERGLIRYLQCKIIYLYVHITTTIKLNVGSKMTRAGK